MTGDTQPPPSPSVGPEVWPLVIARMQARHELGIARYGLPLRAFNGRDPLLDALEESLDQCAYLQAAIIERDAMRAEIVALRETVAAFCADMLSDVRDEQ